MNAVAQPLVTVIIVNYKRREAFLLSLKSVRAQSYSNRDIIVVDNNSQDGIAEFLAAQAPEVRLVELAENLGACGGRNAGIRAARGDIIITLDNDVFFESPFEISKTVDTFQQRPDVHVLAYQLCDELSGALRVREWCHPRSWIEYGGTEFESNFFVEGACAMRREVYETAGLYYEPLFIYCEGWDLGLRILDHNFRIRYTPHIRVRHLMSAETRTPDRPYYFFTRNYIWIACKDYPPLAGFAYLAWKLSMMLYFSIRCRHLKAYFRGLIDGVRGIARARQDRTPIRPATVRYLRELERWRPTLWTRLSRHREAVQL
jgi:GT2 family glycosyltransferase